MEFLTTACTDIGTVKQTNQDSMCIKMAKCDMGNILMAVLCDGMGGLSKGEVASATVVKAFASWFDQRLPVLLPSFSAENICIEWDRLIQELNKKIGDYGRSNYTSLGTTLTVILIVDAVSMIVGHVGDCRVYQIDEALQILTEDQTVVMRDVRRGVLSEKQAENDPRKNVLLQCIGASISVSPDFFTHVPVPGSVYMLCSDGFRHEITPEEIFTHFKPEILISEEVMRQQSESLIALNKERMERDNISVILIHPY